MTPTVTSIQDVEDEPMEQEDLFDDGNDLEALMESGAIDDSITQGYPRDLLHGAMFTSCCISYRVLDTSIIL